MTINRRRKNIRQRGYHTHGWGAKKKHRGAGSRGGRGNAGTGKRGDVKKPSIWKDNKYFGRRNFKRLGFERAVKSINISDIELQFEKLVALKNITEKSGLFEIDLGKLKYNKLLGKGKATRKYNIIVRTASAKAVSKVEAAGGKVVVEPKKEKPEQPVNNPKKSDEAKPKPETGTQKEKEPVKAEAEPKKQFVPEK